MKCASCSYRRECKYFQYKSKDGTLLCIKAELIYSNVSGFYLKNCSITELCRNTTELEQVCKSDRFGAFIYKRKGFPQVTIDKDEYRKLLDVNHLPLFIINVREVIE